MDVEKKMKPLVLIAMLYMAFFATNVNAGTVLVSDNLNISSYSASTAFLGNTADKPFNSNGPWNSGEFTGWIEVNLEQVYDISSLELLITQSPNGVTTHEIWFSDSQIHNDRTNATLFNSLTGFTTDGSLITETLSTPFAAQFVQINTTLSPSWVGWSNIKVYAESNVLPAPSPVLLLASGLIGLIIVRKKLV